MEALPAPAGRVAAEAALERGQGPREARRPELPARLDPRRTDVVAPRRVAAEGVDQEPAARPAARDVPELVLRHLRELDEPRGVDGRRNGVGRHFAVPPREPRQGLARGGVGGSRVEQERQELTRLQRDAVELDGGDVAGRQPRFGLDHLRDPRGPVRLGPRESEGIRVAGEHAIVGRDDESARRIEGERHLLGRDHARPVVLAARRTREPGRRRAAGPASRSGRRVADVALDVGVDEVLRRRAQEARWPPGTPSSCAPWRWRRRPRSSGRPRPVPSSAGPRPRRARSAPVERVGDDRPVDRGPHRQHDVARRRARGSSRGARRSVSTPRGGDSARDPSGSTVFDEEVLHVRLERGQTPGDPVVVGR